MTDLYTFSVADPDVKQLIIDLRKEGKASKAICEALRQTYLIKDSEQVKRFFKQPQTVKLTFEAAKKAAEHEQKRILKEQETADITGKVIGYEGKAGLLHKNKAIPALEVTARMSSAQEKEAYCGQLIGLQLIRAGIYTYHNPHTPWDERNAAMRIWADEQGIIDKMGLALPPEEAYMSRKGVKVPRMLNLSPETGMR